MGHLIFKVLFIETKKGSVPKDTPLFLHIVSLQGQLTAAAQSRPSAVGSGPQVSEPGAGIAVPDEKRKDRV